MKEGDDVIYKGKETFIERLGKNNKATIKNPDWQWIDESECVSDGDIYGIPYWITVDINELTEIK